MALQMIFCLEANKQTYESNADQAKKVPNNQKVKIANGFRKSKGIDNILEDRLLSDAKRKGYSNILIVLDRYLVRK